MKKKVGGWIQRNREVVYDNPWLEVSHHEVITPANTDGIYGVVSFKNIAVGIIPIDEDGFTWLVGQSRYPLNSYSWEIPEGGCPVGTDMLAAAQKELKEETGLTASEWEELMELHLSNSVTDEKAVIYIARGLSQGEMAHEETEDISVRRVSLEQAVEEVLCGKITDAISVAGLLKLSCLKQL